MTQNIVETMTYLQNQFKKSPYFIAHPEEMAYRYSHSIRVANIGAEIAKSEAMDVEAMTIACLLHDISYMHEFTCEEDWLNHGRTSAKITREFLQKLDLSEAFKEDICYGIAIHVDDKSDFEGERTPFAQTIGDADNIDRFDVYRIYENLEKSGFSSLPHDNQLEHVTQKIGRLTKLMEMQFGTQTATQMWRDRLSYQLDFFMKMKAQLESGEVLNI